MNLTALLHIKHSEGSLQFQILLNRNYIAAVMSDTMPDLRPAVEQGSCNNATGAMRSQGHPTPCSVTVINEVFHAGTSIMDPIAFITFDTLLMPAPPKLATCWIQQCFKMQGVLDSCKVVWNVLHCGSNSLVGHNGCAVCAAQCAAGNAIVGGDGSSSGGAQGKAMCMLRPTWSDILRHKHFITLNGLQD